MVYANYGALPLIRPRVWVATISASRRSLSSSSPPCRIPRISGIRSSGPCFTRTPKKQSPRSPLAIFRQRMCMYVYTYTYIIDDIQRPESPLQRRISQTLVSRPQNQGCTILMFTYSLGPARYRTSPPNPSSLHELPQLLRGAALYSGVET